MNQTVSLLFVGGGQMTRALLGGLAQQGLDERRVMVVDPNPTAQAWFASHHPQVQLYESIDAISESNDVMYLCIKPQIAPSLVPSLERYIAKHRPLIISVMAGISSALLSNWFGKDARIARTMPNRPVLLGQGVTAILTDRLSSNDIALAKALLQSTGAVVLVNRDEDIDTVTAISGSGPAYFFLLIELLERMALSQGLSADVARTLSTQTAQGAAAMSLQAGADPKGLRDSVTSPAGTTAAALAVLEAGGFTELFMQALQAAKERAAQLAQEAAKTVNRNTNG